jgi:hypothetical protein
MELAHRIAHHNRWDNRWVRTQRLQRENDGRLKSLRDMTPFGMSLRIAGHWNIGGPLCKRQRTNDKSYILCRRSWERRAGSWRSERRAKICGRLVMGFCVTVSLSSHFQSLDIVIVPSKGPIQASTNFGCCVKALLRGTTDGR